MLSGTVLTYFVFSVPSYLRRNHIYGEMYSRIIIVQSINIPTRVSNISRDLICRSDNKISCLRFNRNRWDIRFRFRSLVKRQNRVSLDSGWWLHLCHSDTIFVCCRTQSLSHSEQNKSGQRRNEFALPLKTTSITQHKTVKKWEARRRVHFPPPKRRNSLIRRCSVGIMRHDSRYCITERKNVNSLKLRVLALNAGTRIAISIDL